MERRPRLRLRRPARLAAELVLPHFLAAFDRDRSNDFQYILEGLYFMHSLVDEATSLNEEA